MSRKRIVRFKDGKIEPADGLGPPEYGDSFSLEDDRETISSTTPAITMDPEIRGGVPVLTGTRIPVSQILSELADGETVDGIAEEYDISADAIRKMLIGYCPGRSRKVNPRRVVCAAIRVGERVICGVRHYDKIMAASKEPKSAFAEQGFVDNQGQFLTREEAWVVANEVGQIVCSVGGNEAGELFSENLY